MLEVALLVLAAGEIQADSQMNPLGVLECTLHPEQDGDDEHTGYLEGFVSTDWGTYLFVNGRSYRLPPGAKVPPYGVPLTFHGVTKSETPDTDYYASSVTW